jgi:hypothetical protein
VMFLWAILSNRTCTQGLWLKQCLGKAGSNTSSR